MMERKFIQYVIKPYNSLSSELSKPWAQEPGLNDYLHSSIQLATNIAHFPEQYLVNQGIKERKNQYPKLEVLRQKYPSLSLMRDVSDIAKHGTLGSKNRETESSVSTVMEVREDGMFRFIRNVIEVKYTVSGDVHDFMKDAYFVINALIDEYGFCDKNKVLPSTNQRLEFSNVCSLYFNHDREVAMSHSNIKFVKKNITGEFMPSNPPIGRVEWHELNQSSI